MVDMEACINRLGFLNVIGIPSEGIGGGFCLAWRDAGLIEIQQGAVGGVRRFRSREGELLRNFLHEAGGVDLGFQGVRCTWKNARKGEKNIRKRLDRGLADSSWCTSFPNAKILNLPILGSDHSPILLSNSEVQSKLNYPFRFLEVWTSSPECEKVVNGAWKFEARGRIDEVLLKKLGNTKRELKRWNQLSFGFCDKNLKKLKSELGDIQNQWPSKENLEKEATVQLSILEMEANLERIWKQKSRENWIHNGDGNTKFFHASTVIRRRRNTIDRVEKNGEWLLSREEIGNYFRENFMQVYESQNPSIGRDFDTLFLESVTDGENADISRCPTVEEIKAVVFQMHPLKSPGPDGFSSIFYRKYWQIVGAKVCEMVQGFFEDPTVSKNLNHTFLCLIPKINNATRFDQFRPISLCNFCYKIISRIVTDRLKVVIDRLVSPYQSAFIPGRWIAECSIMAQEVLHSFKRKKGKQGVMATKTDMSKAYDRLEWSFLFRVLKANGFSDQVCSIIMGCVTSVSYSVLLNGAPLAPFNPKRGLRQGDPLSPYLFILCSEVLSKLICRAEQRGDLSGVKVSREAMPITHLFYADDAIFFCKANGSNAKAILQCINTYELWSGQKVNKGKSGVVFSSNTPQRNKDELKSMLGMNGLGPQEKYLGNPFFFSANKRSDFKFLKEKIVSRLEGWKAKNLSQAGRTTLVNSVLQSIPGYFMSTALVPKSVCEDLDRVVAKFWWIGNSEKQRYRAYKSWNEICQPKRCGGLRLRRFSEINIALLAKLGWMVLTGVNKPWVRLLESKYCQGLDVWQVDKRSGDSRAWRGILEARHVCIEGAGVLIGDGETALWERPWVPGKSMEEVRNGFHYTRRHAFVKVSDLFLEGSRVWNEELIRASFDEDVASAILGIRPLLSSGDIIFWKGSKSGHFTVKSGYWVSQCGRFKSPLKVWERLWQSNIHPRLKLVLWKAWSDILPSKLRLGLVDKSCPFCHEETESVLHLFCFCSVARAVWFQSAWGIRVDDLHWEEISHFGCWWAQAKDERLLLFSACLCEMIWKWRNKIIFQGCSFSLAKLISDINLRVKEMEMRMAPLKLMDRSQDIDVELDFQNIDDLQCFFSDASILNGAAGVAAVKVNVADVGESWVASRFHTVSGVLEGELLAIYLALQMACELGAKKIKVLSDSKVAIMDLKNGCLPYAWGTYPVFESCRCICKCFDLVVFVHCPRSENRVADAVAGWARCAMACSEGLLKDLAPAVAASLM
ncbi:uncharacterized protein LOC115704452 [Cannabis sativa]|uniref:uncharacterized protein LOC115704452 n=1 Tax=Cannabis sativa TaxID=3483 RepID=UPI0029CA148D|nr:uncharacterized protein LOC115704452 [Cannabis sativa]